MVHLESCLLASVVAFSVSQAVPLGRLHYHRDDGLDGVSNDGELDRFDDHRYDPARYHERNYHYVARIDIPEPELLRRTVASWGSHDLHTASYDYKKSDASPFISHAHTTYGKDNGYERRPRARFAHQH
jgi:hypothetical protein